MRPAIHAGAGGERVFVDCDVRHICVEISDGFDPARENRASRIGRGATLEETKRKTALQNPINVGLRSFEARQFQGWIKGTI